MGKHEIEFYLKNGEIWAKITSIVDNKKTVLESNVTEGIMPIVDDYLDERLGLIASKIREGKNNVH